MIEHGSAVDELAQDVHRTLWSDADAALDDALAIEQRVRQIVRVADPLASPTTVAQVITDVQSRIDGLGPLHLHAADSDVSEIMVNGDGSVWIERCGQLECTDLRLAADEAEHLVRRLAAGVGRRIDQTQPTVDVRLPDGSRMHAIIPPLAVDGPCITIRRFAERSVTLSELAVPQARGILEDAVLEKKTVIIAGATSSGKTTLLNALAAHLDPDARVVTIEDAAELRLPGRHVLRLETRRETPNTAAVGVRELVRHALRMRPDRIICGEMRGAEALDLVQAMNTGHEGSLSTVHANGTSDAMRRIETMMLFGDSDLPIGAIREQLAACIDLVVFMQRGAGGARHVSEIAQMPVDVPLRWALETLYLAGPNPCPDIAT